ncbi:12516_t:CDS:2 [Ambispora gerdemannii]|uniref:12516_t:CDS:1 n=1 Tax=Ambispora gerdemannii TaxID=144530 RepID=A0A9N8ZWG1_9GLOM|nr:12516_t:CDS:2 [Ambispora gerdemannii]
MPTKDYDMTKNSPEKKQNLESNHNQSTFTFPIEILPDILEYFAKDSTTLYNLLFVNNEFCDATIPILWRDPFGIVEQWKKSNRSKMTEFFKIFFDGLSKNDVAMIESCGFAIPRIEREPYASYISFMQVFDHDDIVRALLAYFQSSSVPRRRTDPKFLSFYILRQVFRYSIKIRKVSIMYYDIAVRSMADISSWFEQISQRHQKIEKIQISEAVHLNGSQGTVRSLGFWCGVVKLINSQRKLQELEVFGVHQGIEYIFDFLRLGHATLSKIRFDSCGIPNEKLAEITDWKILGQLAELRFSDCVVVASSEILFFVKPLDLTFLSFLEPKMMLKSSSDCDVQFSSYTIDSENSSTQDLYSIIQVNRQWCQVAIPILWSYPFFNYYSSKASWKIITTYLDCVPEADRVLLTLKPTAPKRKRSFFRKKYQNSELQAAKQSTTLRIKVAVEWRVRYQGDLYYKNATLVLWVILELLNKEGSSICELTGTISNGMNFHNVIDLPSTEKLWSWISRIKKCNLKVEDFPRLEDCPVWLEFLPSNIASLELNFRIFRSTRHSEFLPRLLKKMDNLREIRIIDSPFNSFRQKPIVEYPRRFSPSNDAQIHPV